jgi:hypothetical protein
MRKRKASLNAAAPTAGATGNLDGDTGNLGGITGNFVARATGSSADGAGYLLPVLDSPRVT